MGAVWVVPRETIAVLWLRNWLFGDSREICGGDAKYFLPRADSWGGVESLNVHPIYTLRDRMSKMEQWAGGILPGMVRMLIGLGYTGNLIANRKRAHT